MVPASSTIPRLRFGIVQHDAVCFGYCRPMIAPHSPMNRLGAGLNAINASWSRWMALQPSNFGQRAPVCADHWLIRRVRFQREITSL